MDETTETTAQADETPEGSVATLTAEPETAAIGDGMHDPATCSCGGNQCDACKTVAGCNSDPRSAEAAAEEPVVADGAPARVAFEIGGPARPFGAALAAALAEARGETPAVEAEVVAVVAAVAVADAPPEDCVECAEAAAAAQAMETAAAVVDVTVETAAAETEAVAEAFSSPPIDPANPGRFRCVLLIEEQETDDGRIISRGATIWRDPPLPMMLQTETADGHDGAEVAAVIEKVYRQGASVIAEGRFDTSCDGIEAARLVRDRVLTRVSIDGGNVDWEVEIIDGPNGEPMGRMRINAITLLGATIVPFSAFAETYIDYVTASGAVNAGVTGTIEWIEPGADVVPMTTVGRAVLTAAGPRTYPAGYFADPHLPGLTSIRVLPADPDGNYRIYGHLAPWDQCHIGISGVCTVAPRSQSDYAYFRTGTAYTDQGPVSVGTLSMGTDHAERHLSAGQTTAHYDNTGTAAAFVSVGEDDYGIWVAGVLAPGLSEERATAFAASSLSGDWRAIRGHLELVAALAVNVPGFPVMGMRDTEQLSLVAAGYGPETATRQSLARRVSEVQEQMLARIQDVVGEVAEVREALDVLSRLVRPIVQDAMAARLSP